MAKTCTKCLEEKQLIFFHKDKGSKDGYSYHCKECVKTRSAKWVSENKERKKQNDANWRLNNLEKARAQSNQWGKDNKEKARISKRKWSKNNKSKEIELKKQWQQNNKDYAKTIVANWKKDNISKLRYYAANRRAIKINATPSWLSAIHKAQIQEFYDLAIAKSVQTGIEYHVDHIHPLNGNGFNGLHVPWNMQILSAKENISKGNKLLEGK